MAAAGRSLQALCRAAFSLASAASTSAASPTALTQLGLRGAAAAAAATGSWGALQRHAAAAVGLRQLARHLHASAGARLAEQGATPAMNPLQQAPAPLSPMRGPGEFGLGPLDGEGELSDTSRSVVRGLPISPQKLNDFAKVVRGLHIEDALIQCAISPKKAAKIVEKALLSAKANAVNTHGMDDGRLRVAEAWVNKGQHLKRVSMHGRGRSGRRLRYRSHLTVLLREEEEEPQRRTKIVPQLMEREKHWRLRAAQAQGQGKQ